MKLLTAAVLLAACLPGYIRADETSHLAKVDETLSLMRVERTTQNLTTQLETMMDAQLKQMNIPVDAQPALQEIKQRIAELLRSTISWEKLKPVYENIYSETFTDDELDGVIAFYKSPAGKAYIEKMPQLTQKAMALIPHMMADLMPQLQQITEDIRKKYGNAK